MQNYNGSHISSIHDRIKTLRQEKGLTQQQAADGMGFSKTALQNYEFDRVPKLNELKKIKDYYKDVTYDYLIDGENKKEENLIIGRNLGLNDEAIKTLKEAKSDLYKNKKFDIRAYIYLLGLNSLLTGKKNSAFLYNVGVTLISKEIEAKFTSRNKESYYSDIGNFNYSIYRLSEMLKTNLANASIPKDNFFVPNNIEQAEEYLGLLNGSETYILDNWKDIFQIKSN